MISRTIQEIVKFRGDRLFNGAVSIDWFLTDKAKREKAASAFVFHGPRYHGVTQDDIGHAHGHRLQDTVSFASDIVRRCMGMGDDEPFTLAIAGYGTGKSHLALTLATLLVQSDQKLTHTIISSLKSADKEIGAEIEAMLKEASRPCLVIALNGMRNFDLTAEVTKQVIVQLREKSLDTNALDELRPRFKQAATLIRMAGKSIVDELLVNLGVQDVDKLLNWLEEQNEDVYDKVQEFFASRGMPIRALGGESIRDVIDVVARDYCGPGKPFRHALILFDEFGRYTEFATVRSQVAGSGVLQDLFEGVQTHADTVTFVGFIQFELNAYVQRVAPEYKNDILRYITRYQSAKKVYLSANLETLIAHLIEKQPAIDLDLWFDDDFSREESQTIARDLHKWFPQSRNYSLWKDMDSFHAVIRKGCWPLSPFSTWFLFYLTAAGKHLQERSALALLGDFFLRTQTLVIENVKTWALTPVSLWSDELQQELIASEESGQQGSITHAYASVFAKHGNRLSKDNVNILRATVLVSKMGLKVESRDEAVNVLARFSGLLVKETREGIDLLQYEYNILEWDDRFKQFDILGDAVPRTQFLSFIRQRVASTYDENGKAKLFASKASGWCDLLGDLECDFAESHSITTTEWRYQGITSNLDTIEAQIKIAADRWLKSIAVDAPRGTVIYCYVEQSQDPEYASSFIRRKIRAVIQEFGQEIKSIPILVVLLCDEDGILGQALAELSVLEDSISAEDQARFGNLIGAHQEKMRQVVYRQIEELTRKRRYITSLNEDLKASRLARVGTELFERVYKQPLSFPFDGFTTVRGNAADSCQELIIDLLRGDLDYDAVISKPVKVKNRAINVLANSWDIFTKSGKVSRRPTYPVVKKIIEQWENIVKSDHEQFFIGKFLRKICLPPYGANIASAGLLLGVFVAPRIEQLIIVRDGEKYALAQWIQRDIFKKKFLDIVALQNVELTFIGEASSEWETLLDEWELAESHLEKYFFLKKSWELKKRIPIPPTYRYRFIHLDEQSCEAFSSLKKMEKEQDDAFSKIEVGENKKHVGLLSRGAVKLIKIKERMIEEEMLWEKHQIEELEPHIERATQLIVQIFPIWITGQRPVNNTPEAVGDFKHVMLRKIRGNLIKLGLTELSDELEQHTRRAIKQAETIAEANQLIRDVRSWIDSNVDALRLARVAKIRGLKDVGRAFSSRLQGMSRRIKMEEITSVRTQLVSFLSQLKEAESVLTDRAARIWDSKITTEKDLEQHLDEIDLLIRAFEGCDKDIDDFLVMKSALQDFKRYYSRLNDKKLSWIEWNSLTVKLRQEANDLFGEEEALPWSIEEIFDNFCNKISKLREQESLSWIECLESKVSKIDSMSVEEANRLRSETLIPPATLTDNHSERLKSLVPLIDERLECLELDWLIERFKKLPMSTKKKFIEKTRKFIEIS